MAHPLEIVAADEPALVSEMVGILRRKMERDHARGATRRDAHPKSAGVLRGRFIIEPDLPQHLRVGVFAKPREFDCWVRPSNASGKVQPDSVPDIRGLAIKLMETVSEEPAGNRSARQDFVTISCPTMPLGTLPLFRDAVYYAIEKSPLRLLLHFLLKGHLGILKELKASKCVPASPLDIRYWSTTPYQWGSAQGGQVVKYSLIPTSAHKSPVPMQSSLADDYLSQAMQAHLAAHEATFDFCVQLRKDGMPVEDARVRWDEAASPFIKVATLRIAPQDFRTPARVALSEVLSMSPAHAGPEHAPLGAINRARAQIYQQLSAFRHGRDGRVDIA